MDRGHRSQLAFSAMHYSDKTDIGGNIEGMLLLYVVAIL